jgi:hypothetical protein
LKFLFMKRPKTCKHPKCGGIIGRGELYILNSHRNSSTGRYYSFSYHYECYIEYFTERIRQDAMYYMGQLIPPKRLGRPRVYKNGKNIHKLKALRRYHEKAGNMDRVRELTGELARIII